MTEIRSILVALLLMMPLMSWGEDGDVFVEGIQYKLDDENNEATIVGFEDEELTTLTIPATIQPNSNTYNVTGAEDECFQVYENLETVYFKPNQNFWVKPNTFSNCKKIYLIDLQNVKLKQDSQNRYKDHFSWCTSLRYVLTSYGSNEDQEPILEATANENIFGEEEAPKGVKIQIYFPKKDDTVDPDPRIREYNSVMIPKGFHWASFVSYTDVDFDYDDQGSNISEHIGAYVATSYDATKVTLSRVHKVPKDTPALIYTDEPDNSNDKYVVFKTSDSGAENIDTNYLKGSTSVRTPVNNDNIYALINKKQYDNQLVQVPSDQNIYIPPFTAYLDLSAGGQGEPSVSIVIDDDPTGMDNIASDESVSQLIYLLNGKVAPQGYKGIAIINGKKVIIK